MYIILGLLEVFVKLIDLEKLCGSNFVADVCIAFENVLSEFLIDYYQIIAMCAVPKIQFALTQARKLNVCMAD